MDTHTHIHMHLHTTIQQILPHRLPYMWTVDYLNTRRTPLSTWQMCKRTHTLHIHTLHIHTLHIHTPTCARMACHLTSCASKHLKVKTRTLHTLVSNSHIAHTRVKLAHYTHSCQTRTLHTLVSNSHITHTSYIWRHRTHTHS